MNALKPFFSYCLLVIALAGCDQLGIETPDKVAARQEAEGKAIGGACRHAGRALEDCYEMNRRASKAAVYAGWRDMDGYMRENNIAVVKPAAAENEAPLKASVEAKPAANGEKSEEGARKTSEATSGHEAAGHQAAHAEKPTKTS